MTGTPYRMDLGAGPSPAAVLRTLGVSRDLAEPIAALSGRWFGGGTVILTHPVRARRLQRAEDAYDLLDDQPRLRTNDPDLIGGGWLTCLGYAPGHSWIGFFDHLWRHRPRAGWSLETLGLPGRESVVEASLAMLRQTLASDEPPEPPQPLIGAPFAAADDALLTHLRGVESVIAGIERGEYYQLNLCTRLRSRLSEPVPRGAAAALFASVLDRLQPTYGALLDPGDGQALVSLSPELFLAEHAGRVRTAPIKGTSPLDLDPTGARLAASVKDAAENVMITDLMRNDLSRVCRPGTVAVERLLDLERHPGVWHLVSTVGGELRPGIGRGELLRATFPPGSVTGAPKLAAMTGIAGIEPPARGAYTGALGFVTPAAGAEFSVLIRTFEIDGATIELGVGGGITVDSVPVREWYECLHKAEPLITALGAGLAPVLRIEPPPIPEALLAAGLIETLLAVDGEPVRAAAHLARLDRSCRELYGFGLPPDLPERVRRIAAEHHGRRRIRLHARAAAGGLEVRLESHPAGEPPATLVLVRTERPAWCWRHKWADRRTLAEPVPIPGEPLTLPYYLTPDGHLAESSRGNLVVLREDGVWVSPPESEHVLPGVTRRDLLRALAQRGASVLVDDVSLEVLDTARAVLHCSSVAGVLPVAAIDGRSVPSPEGTIAYGTPPRRDR